MGRLSIVVPWAFFLISVPHKAKDVLKEPVPLLIPNINCLSPEQLHRSPAGAGSEAVSSVKSFELHDVGNVCAKMVLLKNSPVKQHNVVNNDDNFKLEFFFLITGSFKK